VKTSQNGAGATPTFDRRRRRRQQNVGGGGAAAAAHSSLSNGKIEMTFEYQSQVKVTVDFSPDLARLSGLRSDEAYVTGEDVISEREPNLLSNIRSVYVYCDLLEHVHVGDTKAPLLRIVDKSTELEGNVHRVFNPILCVPLQKKCFDTVEIDMIFDTGDPVPFLSRKSFVVLEFCRVVHPYFAI